ncbi:GNAT family N-acetyltransferase [Kineococcus sp. SYSU DK001]|uniref:GNAT family N-acetyltransferase n=1 Tax=Kineococcus sp. SYSU DK001 TaxID=3383122 RepID=UPI003D7D4E5D
MSIRDADDSDAAAVAALLAEMGYPTTESSARAHIQRFSAPPSSRLQLAEHDGDVVGLVATHLVPRMDDDAVTCRVTDLVVSSRLRRGGIGSALLAAAEAHARSAGAPRLDLSSGDWREEAHAFYLAAGFQSRSRSFVKRLPQAPAGTVAAGS